MSGVHRSFVTLNPRSHAAVRTGMVFTASSGMDNSTCLRVVAPLVGRWTCDSELASSAAGGALLSSNLRQVVYTLCASVTKQYNLVLT